MKKINSFLKIFLPLSIGIIFIYLTYKSTNYEERKLIIYNIKNANYSFVTLSIFLGFLSHLSRAYRWKFFLAPMGFSPKYLNLTLAVMISYFANLGVPRSGEILRATTLSTYEKIPFENAFGTIVTERVIDLLILICFVLLALFIQYDLILNIINEKNNSLATILITISLLLIFFLIFSISIKKINNPITIRLKKIFKGLVKGILSIKSIENKSAFIFHTVFIWVMYFAMFYVIKWSLPETSPLGFDSLLPAFVVGGLTISTTNGGIGIYPYSVAMILTSFNISNESGLSFGWIIWTAQTIMITLFGSLSFFILPLVNSKK